MGSKNYRNFRIAALGVSTLVGGVAFGLGFHLYEYRYIGSAGSILWAIMCASLLVAIAAGWQLRKYVFLLVAPAWFVTGLLTIVTGGSRAYAFRVLERDCRARGMQSCATLFWNSSGEDTTISAKDLARGACPEPERAELNPYCGWVICSGPEERRPIARAALELDTTTNATLCSR